MSGVDDHPDEPSEDAENPPVAIPPELDQIVRGIAQIRVTEEISRVEAFSGPLPPPEVLRGYNDVLPGAAERIFTMAEAQAEHRRRSDPSVG